MKEAEKVLFEILALVAMLVVTVVNAGGIDEVTGIYYGCGDTVIENCTLSKNLSCMTQYGLLIFPINREKLRQQLEIISTESGRTKE